MDTNFPSIYLGQSVDFFFPPAIPFDQMNDEQKASFLYWKQYAEKHHIAYDYDENNEIISNFRATERHYEETDKQLVDMIKHVDEKRSGTKMRFFYFILAVIGYIFLHFYDGPFSFNTHIIVGLIGLVFCSFLYIRFRHYYMHPDRTVVARVLILNEQKQKSWTLAHFSKSYWEKQNAAQSANTPKQG